MRTAVLAVLSTAALLSHIACSGLSAQSVEPQYTGDPAADILEAVKAGDDDKVGEMLDADASLTELRDAQGRTLLHYAVLANADDVVDLLVERGMDANVKDALDMTPLAVLEDSGIRAEDARSAIRKNGGVS